MKKIIILFLVSIGFAFTSVSAQQHPQIPETTTTTGKDLMIPNAFSPNGDGNNDVFKILNFTNQTLIEFKVFNRWGTVVFKTENPKEGWDGKYKNTAQPMGVYGYAIRIVYPEGIENTYKGTVTLIR